jgi:hypothetical protein
MLKFKIIGLCTAGKLLNTNGNIDEIFLSVDCSEFYRQNILSLYPLVNTDITIPSIYIVRITVGKKKLKKYDDVSFI